MPAEVFLDASYAVALSSSRDLHHARAVALAQRLRQAGTRLLTTRAVVLEIGNALSKLRATVKPPSDSWRPSTATRRWRSYL